MAEKFLVDTCVLFYLVDKNDAEKHRKASRWFESLKGENFFVSTQNLREFASVALK